MFKGCVKMNIDEIKKEYKKLDDFKGKLSQQKSVDPAFYSRVQFMKYFRGFKTEG